MKMKLIVIAAIVAAQLPFGAVPAEAADLPRAETNIPQTRFEGRIERNLDAGPDSVIAGGAASAPLHAASAQETEEKPRKKRKSTGDKVLTGAAVVLGIGALAVGGLLVAIFVS